MHRILIGCKERFTSKTSFSCAGHEEAANSTNIRANTLMLILEDHDRGDECGDTYGYFLEVELC
jgi:hypothetical protein